MKFEPIAYASHYGGRCRGCADENGVCPTSGLPCDPNLRLKAAAHCLKAWQYGIEHGFMNNPFPSGTATETTTLHVAASAASSGYHKEIVLLSIIQAAGGETDSSESKWNWINWFCGDEREGDDEDTFNRCHTKGWLSSTHDSDTDRSVTTLTAAGRELLVANTPKDAAHA